jgi:hypothetical protein
MENRISKLKVDFNNITSIRNNVKGVFDILQLRINKLKLFYSEFIKNNKNKLFVFGLDSFHFQSKLIDVEYDDMKRLFLAINNRMYCEYFKLYKIITEYIYENINDKKITEIIKVNNFPVYKDLEPFKEYSFETTTEIHENILVIVNSIISNLNTRENELNIHRGKQALGLNIDNFITTYNFELTVMKEKISMFLTYIEFFHKLHTKHLKRFSNKIQLMYTHISTDIRFDETIEMNKEKKKEIIDEFAAEQPQTNEIKLNMEEQVQRTETSPIITDEESVKMINDIIDNNHDKSVHNITPLSINSNNVIFNEESQITDENVYDNFKHIKQSCDNLLSKDNIDTVNLTTTANNNDLNTNNDLPNNDHKATTEISDISDDVSVMSEIIIDELDNPTFSTVTPSEKPKPKPTRGRKKKN